MKPHLRSFLLGLVLVISLTMALLPSSPVVSQADTGKCDFNAVAKAVGELQAQPSAQSDVNVILIQEIHTVVAGQLESAVMVHRLITKCGYRFMGLEGAFPKTSFDTSWYHNTAIPFSALARTAVDLLGEGEISQLEFAALVYPFIQKDVKVAGIDDEQLYNQDPLGSATSDIEVAMLYVGLVKLSDADLSTAANMIKNKPDSKDPNVIDRWRDNVMRFVFTRSQDSEVRDWYKVQSATLPRCVTLGEDASIDQIDKGLVIVKKNQAEVKTVLGIDVTKDIEDTNAVRAFYQIARDRSVTMVKEIEKGLKDGPNGKVVAVIGAAHTETMAKQLKADGNGTLVLSARSYCDNNTSTSLSNDAYDQKTHAKSVDAKGLLGALLQGNSKKPQTVINEPWFHVKSFLYGLATLANQALANNPKAGLAEIFKDVKPLPGVEIDMNSLTPVKTREGNTGFIFRVNIDINGIGPKQITIGINTALNKPGMWKIDEQPDQVDIEKLLLTKLDQVKSGRKLPSGFAEVAPNVRAAFGTDREGITKAISNS